MLDLGWTEILVIGVVALIVIGPRDLPVALHTFGKYVGKLKAMARDFQHGIDEIARQHELRELQQGINKFSSPEQAIENYVNRLEKGAKKPVVADGDEVAGDHPEQGGLEDWSAASAEAATPAAKSVAAGAGEEPELALDQTATDDPQPELALDAEKSAATAPPADDQAPSQAPSAATESDEPKPGPTASS